MKRYKIKIGFTVSFEIFAENKKEAEECAWFEFDQIQQDGDMIKMDIKEIKSGKNKHNKKKI